VTHPFNPNKIQFYLTVPAPCPYLPNLMERKVFTQLDPIDGPILNNHLTQFGFRRSQNVIYRPACENCNSCESLRIRVTDFITRKSFRRVNGINADIRVSIMPPMATDEQFTLLQQYLTARHNGGGMSDMDFHRYQMMVEECASETDVIEFRDTDNNLLGVTLIDKLTDGYSMVYSFYDTNLKARSLGTFMILSQINRCKNDSLPYLYLGYWVKGSTKMQYKSRFQPYELLSRNGWHEGGNT